MDEDKALAILALLYPDMVCMIQKTSMTGEESLYRVKADINGACPVLGRWRNSVQHAIISAVIEGMGVVKPQRVQLLIGMD